MSGFVSGPTLIFDKEDEGKTFYYSSGKGFITKAEYDGDESTDYVECPKCNGTGKINKCN